MSNETMKNQLKRRNNNNSARFINDVYFCNFIFNVLLLTFFSFTTNRSHRALNLIEKSISNVC